MDSVLTSFHCVLANLFLLSRKIWYGVPLIDLPEPIREDIVYPSPSRVMRLVRELERKVDAQCERAYNAQSSSLARRSTLQTLRVLVTFPGL